MTRFPAGTGNHRISQLVASLEEPIQELAKEIAADLLSEQLLVVTAERDALFEALVRVIADTDREGGFMKTERQANLRQAKSLIAEPKR